MPERSADTGYWTHPDIQPLSKDSKLLYFYAWNNEHCNPAGLYEITPRTIAFETAIDEANLPSLFEELDGKVKYYWDLNLLWCKNFIKRQSRSSKFEQAAAKALTKLSANGPIQELLAYNQDKHSISIPYQYYMDNISILARASGTGTGTKGGGGGGKKPPKRQKGYDVIR